MSIMFLKPFNESNEEVIFLRLRSLKRKKEELEVDWTKGWLNFELSMKMPSKVILKLEPVISKREWREPTS